MFAQGHPADTEFLFQFAGSGFSVALAFLHHAARGHVPVARVQRLAQGAAMHAELAGGIEQQDEAAPGDQPALAQFGAGQAAEGAVLLIDPGHPLGIRGGAMGRLAFVDGHQPCSISWRRSITAALAREM
ncbi:hypothetical protein D9M68_811180 [compost metagenome]